MKQTPALPFLAYYRSFFGPVMKTVKYAGGILIDSVSRCRNGISNGSITRPFISGSSKSAFIYRGESFADMRLR